MNRIRFQTALATQQEVRRVSLENACAYKTLHQQDTVRIRLRIELRDWSSQVQLLSCLPASPSRPCRWATDRCRPSHVFRR